MSFFFPKHTCFNFYKVSNKKLKRASKSPPKFFETFLFLRFFSRTFLVKAYCKYEMSSFVFVFDCYIPTLWPTNVTFGSTFLCLGLCQFYISLFLFSHTVVSRPWGSACFSYESVLIDSRPLCHCRVWRCLWQTTSADHLNISGCQWSQSLVK